MIQRLTTKIHSEWTIKKNIVEPKGHISRPNVATKPESLVAYPYRKNRTEVEATCISELRVGLKCSITCFKC